MFGVGLGFFFPLVLGFLKVLSPTLLVSQSLPTTFLSETPLFPFLLGNRLPYSGYPHSLVSWYFVMLFHSDSSPQPSAAKLLTEAVS